MYQTSIYPNRGMRGKRMKQHVSIVVNLHLLLLILSIICCIVFLPNKTSAALAMPKSGCQRKCGNLNIDFPFGIGKGCYLDETFEVSCDNSSNTAFLPHYLRASLLQISQDYVILNYSLIPSCFNESGSVDSLFTVGAEKPFTVSLTRNKFVAIGCDVYAYITDDINPNHTTGCVSLCGSLDGPSDIPIYSGKGYCKTSLPQSAHSLNFGIFSVNTWTRSWTKTNCSYPLIVEENFSNFEHFGISNNTGEFEEMNDIPIVFDWSIGSNSCAEAKKTKDYVCGNNTDCQDFARGTGYNCHCKPGYDGNPYLSHGCQDIDECKVSNGNCKNNAICINTPGDFYCKCPSGYHGYLSEDGFGCYRDRASLKAVFIGTGIAGGVLFLVSIGFWLYLNLQRRKKIKMKQKFFKRKKIKMKQKFFKRNGGLLLQQQISSSELGSVVKTKLFTIEELEKATNDFSEIRVLGKGGLGTVYKGMLQDGSIAAVKKANVINEGQVGQFINEVLILSQINHRNIVKLLGCCLEIEVPLLVYEFVSNGTLSHHLHDEGNMSKLSWKNRLRIAGEVAGALSYLHSSASKPIFHRDIKSSNILLDENYRAVVSDFGISRLIALNETHLTTLVGGTFGYLDPEYFCSGQFTDKSDVYSFGVVLAELLTGYKAVCTNLSVLGLAMHFRLSMKQNRLFQILDTLVVEEGKKEDILLVAEVAKKCLNLSATKRPNMKEVAADLERLTRTQVQPPRRVKDNYLSEAKCSHSCTLDGIVVDYSSSCYVFPNHTA